VVGLTELQTVEQANQVEKRSVRTCFACRNKGEKSSMLRLVVDDAGLIWPDVLQKAPSRGVYLCMQEACFSSLNDKRLGALRQKFVFQQPQWAALKDKIIDVLEKSIRLQLLSLKSSAAIGRDAVMHQMWESKPLLLLLAKESGQALVRQVMSAVQKRDEEGLKTIALQGFSEGYLLDVFQREKMAVVGLLASKKTAKLQRYCAWYGRIKGSRVSNVE